MATTAGRMGGAPPRPGPDFGPAVAALARVAGDVLRGALDEIGWGDSPAGVIRRRVDALDLAGADELADSLCTGVLDAAADSFAYDGDGDDIGWPDGHRPLAEAWAPAVTRAAARWFTDRGWRPEWPGGWPEGEAGLFARALDWRIGQLTP